MECSDCNSNAGVSSCIFNFFIFAESSAEQHKNVGN